MMAQLIPLRLRGAVLITHQRHFGRDRHVDKDAELVFDLQKLSRADRRKRLLDLAMSLFQKVQPRPLATEPLSKVPFL
jgi:hypothetical protein